VRTDVRYLIVNGDDFGLTDGVSRGILEACQRGILRSASLMVLRPAAETAVNLASRVPQLGVGLHLELDDRSGPDAATAAEVQLRLFADLTGTLPTHIDSHHDRHREPDVLPGVLALAARHGLPVRGSSPVRRISDFYGRWGGEAHPEHVGAERLVGLLESRLTEGFTELICPPGYADGSLRSGYRLEREAELETLCDPRVGNAVARLGIRLVDFRELASTVVRPSGTEREGPWPE
jgi:predicted glycoside hydrolase/deacetylase ChbG (UPF0249 family)